MGKILCRYICREIATPFFVALLIFTTILLTVRILKLVELIVNRGVPLWQIGKVFLYITPAFFEVTVPMSFLLAILWGFGRFSADREIIALKSCGLSFVQIVMPVGLLTIGILVGTFFLTIYARPWSNAALRQVLFDIAKTRATAGLKEKTFNDKFDGVVIYAEEIQPPGTVFQGIMIADSRDPTHRNTIFAREGLLFTNEEGQLLTLRLRDGAIHSLELPKKSYQTTHFSTYDLSLSLPTVFSEANKEPRSPQELPFHTLRSIIAVKQHSSENNNAERSELHRRLSLPFSCVVFALIALPLSIKPTWSLRSNGFALSLVIIMSYYLLLTIGETLGKKGTLPPAIALWLPNIGLGSIGVMLFAYTCWEGSLQRSKKALQGPVRPYLTKFNFK